jgi:hypothetical protein
MEMKEFLLSLLVYSPVSGTSAKEDVHASSSDHSMATVPAVATLWSNAGVSRNAILTFGTLIERF